MLHVLVPSDETIRSIQANETAFYWSVAYEAALRRNGIVNVVTERTPASDAANTLCIITRGQEASPTAHAQIIEGPLTPGSLSRFGLSATDDTGERLDLYTHDHRALGFLTYPVCRVRKIPAQKSTEKSDPYQHDNADKRWNNRTIRYQWFAEIPEGWSVVLNIKDKNGERRPVALRKGNQLVLGVPLMDLLSAGYAFAPLDAGYYDMVSNASGTILEYGVADLVRNMAIENNVPLVEVEWWPHGKTAALSIRQDIDRLISDEALAKLLKFYRRRKVKASFGVLLKNKITPQQVAMMRAGGHEINLHTVSDSLELLTEERKELESIIGDSLAGFHSHGGGGSQGFLGGWHHQWGEEAGFEYLEMGGRSTRQPHHVVRIYNDIPGISKCVAPAAHTSIDAGTKPEAHNLESMLELLPRYLQNRSHFVIMNHPDIHIPQLFKLIKAVKLKKYWAATLAEACAWYNATRGAQYRAGTLHFSRPLPHPCKIQYRQGDSIQILTAPAASLTIAVPEQASTMNSLDINRLNGHFPRFIRWIRALCAPPSKHWPDRPSN